MLAAAAAGLEVSEYSPLTIKSSVVGYGRAEKQQVQHMVTRLLELPVPPEPLDASDALAIAICLTVMVPESFARVIQPAKRGSIFGIILRSSV